MDSKNLTLCCVFIMAITIISCFMVVNQGKETQITLLSSDSLYEGDSIKIQLTTKNGEAIQNQTVRVTLITSDGSKDTFDIKTDSEGIATLKLDGIASGEYKLECEFRGIQGYTESNYMSNIKIKEAVKTHTLADHPPKMTTAWVEDVWSSQRYNDEYSFVTYRDGCTEYVLHSQMPYD